MTSTDRYGRSWSLASDELCPECGQPDNIGDCNHAPLTDEEAALLSNDLFGEEVERTQVRSNEYWRTHTREDAGPDADDLDTE